MVGLLNHFRVTFKDTDSEFAWATFLMDTLQSSEGALHLSNRYWELLAELAICLLVAATWASRHL